LGTQFKDIYSLNSVIKDDYRLQAKTTNQIYQLYFLYLEHSISYFVYDCNKNLTNYIPFSQQEYYFASTPTDKEYLLNPKPPDNCEFYVGYRENSDVAYTQTYDFTYNSLTNVLTINTDMPNNYDVYISGYIIGSFIDTLDLVEQRILSEGLNVPFDEEAVQRQSLLNQMIYGGTSKTYSQANHMKEIKDIAKNQYWNIVKNMINEYSYRSQSNLNGLGGGLI
jgi:hypothetical protein